jgi:hypothetical protein
MVKDSNVDLQWADIGRVTMLYQCPKKLKMATLHHFCRFLRMTANLEIVITVDISRLRYRKQRIFSIPDSMVSAITISVPGKSPSQTLQINFHYSVNKSLFLVFRDYSL